MVLYSKSRGFTLLEILIALVIFAIIGVLASLSLHRTIRNNQIINTQDEKLSQMQLAVTLIRRDLLQAINRPISGGTNAFSGSGSDLEFTRAGLVDPGNMSRRTDMQRVAYKMSGNALSRLTWDTLDRAPGAKPSVFQLLKNVSSVSWSFVDDKNQVVSAWPYVDKNNNDIKAKSMPLPKAVLLKLKITGEGEIDGVFPVPATGGVNATTDTTTDSQE